MWSAPSSEQECICISGPVHLHKPEGMENNLCKLELWKVRLTTEVRGLGEVEVEEVKETLNETVIVKTMPALNLTLRVAVLSNRAVRGGITTMWRHQIRPAVVPIRKTDTSLHEKKYLQEGTKIYGDKNYNGRQRFSY